MFIENDIETLVGMLTLLFRFVSNDDVRRTSTLMNGIENILTRRLNRLLNGRKVKRFEEENLDETNLLKFVFPQDR